MKQISILMTRRNLTLCAVAAGIATLAGCGTPAPRATQAAGGSSTSAGAGPAAGQRATEWVEPYVFQLRNTAGSALRTAGANTFAVESVSAPEIAKVVAAELAASGLPMAKPGKATTVLSLTAKITIAPPNNYDPRAVVDFLPLTEQALATGRSLTGAESTTAGLRQLVIPLGGYRTSFGSTGASQAGVYFVLANLLGATGAREKFNKLFGADATGTVCFRTQGVNDLICDKKMGPLTEVTLSLSGGGAAPISATHSLIQLSANPMQALTYAVSDLRDAALGRPTPVCNYKNSKTREPGCNVVPITTVASNIK